MTALGVLARLLTFARLLKEDCVAGGLVVLFDSRLRGCEDQAWTRHGTKRQREPREPRGDLR